MKTVIWYYTINDFWGIGYDVISTREYQYWPRRSRGQYWYSRVDIIISNASKVINCFIISSKFSNAAFTLSTIRPRLESWSSSWTNRYYRIQSYQIASHLDINRDNRANRRKIFGCQKFCHDYHDWRDNRDHRIRSYDIVTNRHTSYLILFLNRGDRDRPKHRALLRWVAISYELLRSVTIREKMHGPINYEAMRMTTNRIRSDTSKCDETRQATLLPRMPTICYELSIH